MGVKSNTVTSQEDDLLEVRDAIVAPAMMSYQEIMKMVLNRKLSLKALLRQPPSNDWQNVAKVGDLQYACPYLKFADAGLTVDKVNGYACIGSSPGRLISFSKTFMERGFLPKVEFFVPALVQEYDLFLAKDCSLVKLWDGFYVGCVLESGFARPLTTLNMFVLAFNLLSEPQYHALVPYGYDVPEAEKEKLRFSLPAQSWDIRMLSIPVAQQAGKQHLEIKGVGVPHGTFLHRHYEGFGFSFEVMSPDKLEFLEAAKMVGGAGVHALFKHLGADAIKTLWGEKILYYKVMDSFERWVTLERVENAVKGAGKDPARLGGELASSFMALQYGMTDKSSFVSD